MRLLPATSAQAQQAGEQRARAASGHRTTFMSCQGRVGPERRSRARRTTACLAAILLPLMEALTDSHLASPTDGPDWQMRHSRARRTTASSVLDPEP